jgi:hypothetical protein
MPRLAPQTVSWVTGICWINAAICFVFMAGNASHHRGIEWLIVEAGLAVCFVMAGTIGLIDLLRGMRGSDAPRL